MLLLLSVIINGTILLIRVIYYPKYGYPRNKVAVIRTKNKTEYISIQNRDGYEYYVSALYSIMVVLSYEITKIISPFNTIIMDISLWLMHIKIRGMYMYIYLYITSWCDYR
jgi:hypothetical protein